MFIDTHCHLFFENFENDIETVIQNALDAGVDYILIPGTDLETSKQAIKLAERFDMIYAAAGIHPHDTKEWSGSEIDEIRKLAAHPKVVAIGEIGLDYYYDYSPPDIQKKAFRTQLDLALELDLPVIIHNRDSNEDMMTFIREYRETGLRAQFHCFAGSAGDAKELIDMGHYISFTGNITFKSRESLRQIVTQLKPENLLLETDSPFMTPVPHRGKRNEPAYVKINAEKLAELFSLSPEDIGRTTSLNAWKLFGIGEAPELHKTYKIRNSLYINLTNRCNCKCVFCSRTTDPVIKGHNLKMASSAEPPAIDYINEIGDPTIYDEVVFCGYGEPTLRWEELKEIARHVKKEGGRTRLNTNGHGSFLNKRDITPELEGLIDTVSVSLNSADREQYSRLTGVPENLYDEMIKFIRSALQYSRVIVSVVACEGVDIPAARKLATEELNVEFRERNYFRS